MGSSGCLVQADIPASAREAPINCRKPRRDNPSSHSEAPLGNSRCSISWNSSLPASSSKLRQYCGPFVSAIFACTVARSSFVFLLGQTSGPAGFPFLSSVFINVELQKSKARAPFLSVTGRATRDFVRRAYLVILFQLRAQGQLFGVLRATDINRFC